MKRLKYKWRYGEHETQTYYEANVNGDYLCVFANRWNPNTWMGMFERGNGGVQMIHDKTINDRQRKAQGLPKGCSPHELRIDVLLCSTDPEYMMAKVQRCYAANKCEICH